MCDCRVRETWYDGRRFEIEYCDRHEAAPALYGKHETIACLAEYYLLSGGTVEELTEQLRTIFNEAEAALALVDKETR